MSHLDYDTLEAAFASACSDRSDMLEHCPLLRRLAARCKHCTEFGVRDGVSTTALLAGCADGGGTLVSYDTDGCWRAFNRLMPLAAGRWKFVQGSSLAVTIESADLLMIDTVHTGRVLYSELDRHAGQVAKWVVMHDTQEFAVVGDDMGEGMAMALGRFLAVHPEWRVARHWKNCHGLTVLSRGGIGLAD